MATSSAKTPASPKPAAKSAPAPKKAAIGAPKVAPPSVDGQIEAGAAPGGTGAPAKPAAPLVKKKDLVARVVEALDGKKKGTVKDIVEATLATLGEALQKGESLNLPPFGKARVAKQTGEGAESVITLRLRGAGEKIAPKGPKEALAVVGDND
jgi:nucleoid DNA-binding protein